MPVKELLVEQRNSKVKQLLFLFYVCLFVIVVRLYYLQIDQQQTFVDLGKRNFLRTEIIPSPRGNFLDCHGVVVASNRPIFDLYWQGSGNYVLSGEQSFVLKKIKNIIENGIFKLDRKYAALLAAERHKRQFLIKENISFSELCLVNEQCGDSPNLVILNRFVRFYPYGDVASHILGYLGRSEKYSMEGRMGLERLLHDRLKGESGYVVYVANSKGQRLGKEKEKKAIAGMDVRLTIDFELQKIAEELFEEDQAGAFILMDPEDGSIKVMASHPSFDPNLFLRTISEEEWAEKFSVNSPLINRAINAVYPPASIFKLVTYTAGLEEQKISFDDKFVCKGFITFSNRKYMCQRRWGHGELDLKSAIAYSCNIPCYLIAQKLRIDQFAEYAYRFGLGRKTNFLLSEKSGLVPTYGWKVAVKGEPWWKGETLSASLGQSYLLVTPLQIARMVGGICKGFLVKPRILEDEEVEKETLWVSDETLSFLRDAMAEAVRKGTAKIMSGLKSFKIYAKTGTAQTRSKKQESLDKSQLEHAWFVSYFYYKNNDPLVLVVLIEHAGSSRQAQKLAYKFFKEYEVVKQ